MDDFGAFSQGSQTERTEQGSNGPQTATATAMRTATVRQGDRRALRGRRLRVAVVGCGYWGPKVVRAAASLPDARSPPWSICNVDLATALGRQYPGARIASSLEEVLDDVDAVIIATNPGTHTEVASIALEAGKHVLVEKPMALSAADCRLLGGLARANGVVLMAGHTFRFSPSVQLHLRPAAVRRPGRDLLRRLPADEPRPRPPRRRRDLELRPARHLDHQPLDGRPGRHRPLPRLRLPAAGDPRPGVPAARVRVGGRPRADQLAQPEQGAADDGRREQEDGRLRRRRRPGDRSTTPASTASGWTSRSPTSARSTSSA